MFRICVDGLILRYVPKVKMMGILVAFYMSPVGITLKVLELCTSSYDMDTIVPPFTKMHMTMYYLVTNAEGKETSR